MFRNLKPVILLAALPIFAACSALESDLIGQGVVTTVIEDGQSARIKFVTVSEEDSNIVIRGDVRQPYRCCGFYPIRGHVDIKITSVEIPDTNLSNVNFHSRRKPRKGARQYRFIAMHPMRVTKGTVVHLKHHQEEH